MLFWVCWIPVCCKKVATKGSYKNVVWGLNVLDCDGVVSGWSHAGDVGRRTCMGFFVGCK